MKRKNLKWIYLVVLFSIIVLIGATGSKSITDFTEMTDLDSDDVLIVVDTSAGATRKMQALRFIDYTVSQGYDSLKIDTVYFDTAYVVTALGFADSTSEIYHIQVKNLFDVSRNDTISGKIRFTDTTTVDSHFVLKDTLFTGSMENLNKVDLFENFTDSSNIVSNDRGYGRSITGSYTTGSDTLRSYDCGRININADTSSVTLYLDDIGSFGYGSRFMLYATNASNTINIITTPENGSATMPYFSLLTSDKATATGDTIVLNSAGSCVTVEALSLTAESDTTSGTWTVNGGNDIEIK